MIHQRMELHAGTGAYMETYLLSNSDQIQIGRRRGAVLICPGGAYLRTSDQEAEQVALHFNALGLHAAVVRYSCGVNARMPGPLLELAWAVAQFRENAAKWYVDPERIAVCGFSAGGHLAALLSTSYADAAKELKLEAKSVRPDCAILGYPVTDLNIPLPKVPLDGFTIGEVDPAAPGMAVIPLYRSALCAESGAPRLDFRRAMLDALFGNPEPDRALLNQFSPALHASGDTPPSFIWTTANDNLVPASNALNYAVALWSRGVPCEFHMFADGVHGLSLADSTVADGPEGVNPPVSRWFSLAAAWLKKQGFLP